MKADIVVAVAAIMLLGGLAANAQTATNQWLRVTTGEELTIDVNRASLILEPGSLLRAEFRTTYFPQATVPGRAELKYSSRLDQIEFNTKKPEYRILESSLLDASGKLVQTSRETSDKWKPLFGNTAHLLLSAASKLAPFGSWNVITYHYASGEGPASDDPESLRSLVGRSIEIRPSYLFIGNSSCPDATTEFRHASDRDLSPFGLSLKDFGVDGMNMTIIAAVCKSNKDYPSQIMVFLQSPSKAQLLWDGVFFEIERPPNDFKP